MPAKKKIESNRTRYRTCAFRMSNKEWAELNHRIELSGRQRQDYLIKSVLYQEIVVIGNQVLFETMNEKLDAILVELKCLDDCSDLDDESMFPIRSTMDILEGFKQE